MATMSRRIERVAMVIPEPCNIGRMYTTNSKVISSELS
jgi:hypothetical protein